MSDRVPRTPTLYRSEGRSAHYARRSLPLYSLSRGIKYGRCTACASDNAEEFRGLVTHHGVRRGSFQSKLEKLSGKELRLFYITLKREGAVLLP